MPTPNEKQIVHLIVPFEVTTVAGESAERMAVDWLNSVLHDAPCEGNVKPHLPVPTSAEYQRQAHQVVRQLVELLESRGDTVPNSFREVLASDVEPLASQ